MMNRSRSPTSYSMLDDPSTETEKNDDFAGPSTGDALKDGYTREARAPRVSGRGLMSLGRANAFDDMRDFGSGLGGFGSPRSRVASMIEDDDFFHPW